MPEPDQPQPSAGFGGLLQSLQAGLSWFNRQSENTRIGMIVAVSIIGPIGLIALYSFISDNLVTILVVFAALGLLSVSTGVALYLRMKRQNEADDRRRLAENMLACPSCTEWNDKEAEFCRNCARPFKDQKMLADFLAYQERQPAGARDAWSPQQEAPRTPEAPAPAAPRPRKVVFAADRSFTWPALITMLLYLFLCWPIGAIANLMWLSEAERIYQRTGVSPSGRGCLKLLGWVFILAPFVLIVIVGLVLYLQSQGVLVPHSQE